MKTRHFLKIIFTLCSIILFNGVGSVVIAQGVKVIIIDPGHGGSISPGATYRGVKEKDLVLPIALRVGELLKANTSGVKIVYTRTKDVSLKSSIKADLAERNRIANDSKGDLFISIHANAAVSSAYGVETIIMGESSLEQQRNDAAVYNNHKEDLIDMSNQKTAAIVRAYISNLQFTYGEYSEALAKSIQQSYGTYGRHLRKIRRQPLMVLYGADMPAVLTEIGFMTNAKEFAYMTSKKGKEEIAQSIYKGIKNYIDLVNNVHASSGVPQHDNHSSVGSDSAAASSDDANYAIQVFVSKKVLNDNDPQFKSYKGKCWYKKTTGNYSYKYYIGHYATYEDAKRDLAAVRRSFKDAYIVNIK